MDSWVKGQRSFPGGLTLEEWQAVPFVERIDLIWRAQCDLLGSFRHCDNKRCRRRRTCSGDDTGACRERLWRRKTAKKKALVQEWVRLDALQAL